jgi:ABC-type enterobactin transport system permease subunit
MPLCLFSSSIMLNTAVVLTIKLAPDCKAKTEVRANRHGPQENQAMIVCSLIALSGQLFSSVRTKALHAD